MASALIKILFLRREPLRMKSSDLLLISLAAYRNAWKFVNSEVAEHGQAVVLRELRRKCFRFSSV